ncbi:MAG: cytochrome c biogenesis protein ResB [Desulfuromonadales bacterium]
MTTPKLNLLHSVWNFFCSLKLTIFTLILLALTSIIGTVIQQNRSPEEYIRQYGEGLYTLFERLQFFDMYRAWWFLALLILFCLNLIACSIKRLPGVWKTVREPSLTMAPDTLLTLANHTRFDSRQNAEETAQALSESLSSRFARPVLTRTEDGLHLFAQKAAWARFGVYVTHLSILIIFIGAIIGNIWGYKAFVNIVEGDQVNQVWPRGGGEPIDLGFTVRCDSFSVTYYDNSMRPKEYASVLDVIEDDQEVISDRKIIVNTPLNYKGITFYQSSYGPAGPATIRMRVTPKGGTPFVATNREGDHTPLPNGYSFAVTGYAQSYQGMGPAVQMHVNTPDGRHGNPFIVLQNYPDFDSRRGGEFAFALLDYKQPQYTGLQVNKDPGVWVVWIGCLLLILGTMAAFMISHRRIWITIEPKGEGSVVHMGASAHRNQAAFALYFDELKKDLTKNLVA